jgi:Holliday junction resolvase RusA-like endonuclease
MPALLDGLVYSVKVSFLIEEGIETFHSKEKLKESMTTQPDLQKILKGLLDTKEETKLRQEDSRKNKPF